MSDVLAHIEGFTLESVGAFIEMNGVKWHWRNFELEVELCRQKHFKSLSPIHLNVSKSSPSIGGL